MSATQVVTRSRSGAARQSSAATPDAASVTTTSAGGPLLETDHQDRRNLRLSVRLVDTIRHYWDLGFTAFGGPGVHVVILRKRFVDKFAWLDDTTFADLFSLGNALPGPGSTQLAFSIAVARNGTLAGLVAFLFWSIPGAAGMAALGAGVRKFPERLPPIVLALLTGLNASAVGLIALAAYQLSQSSITDAVTRLLVLASASFGICYHAPWMYPVLVFGGGLITLLYDFRHRIVKAISSRVNGHRSRSKKTSQDNDATQPDQTQDIELEPVASTRRASLDATDKKQPGPAVQELPFQAGTSSTAPSLRQRTAATVNRNDLQNGTAPDASVVDRRTPIMVLSRNIAVALGAGFIALVAAVVVTRSQLSSPPRAFDFFTNMMIAGVIIFGGGPVVIPLLRGYTVENGWVESRDFLLGFAILQAFPGPNFNFAAYLGVLAVPNHPALGAVVGWLGIFSPGILLKLSLLPIYNTWRKHEMAKSVLRGLNASATGLVFTAVWQLFLVGYIYTPAQGKVVEASSQSGPLTSDPFWGVVASSAFVATQWFKSPPAVTIVAGAVAGLAWFGVVGAAATETQEELGKRNAWLRKTLTETSILPTTVETALSLTTGPLLSDGQKQAIVQLVEYSQKGVANKLTDPGLQKRTLTGAKTAQSSTSRAVTGWSRGLKGSRERKKAESGEKKESKKREKEDKRQIKEELKRERHEMIRLRQQQMLQSDAAGDSRVVASSGQLGSNSVEQSLASLQMQSEGDTSSSSEDDDERGTTITNHGPINANNWQTGVSSIADTATLTVLSDPITDASANSSVGGTNTTFVVEPGLAISCSLVVVKGGQDLEQRLELAREKSSFSAISQQPDLHGASTVPPPPPSHPEVLAIRRQSGTGAPTLTGVAQPPIPPRPTTYRPS